MREAGMAARAGKTFAARRVVRRQSWRAGGDGSLSSQDAAFEIQVRRAVTIDITNCGTDLSAYFVNETKKSWGKNFLLQNFYNIVW